MRLCVSLDNYELVSQCDFPDPMSPMTLIEGESVSHESAARGDRPLVSDTG